MPTIEDIMNQTGNETGPAEQIRRLAEIVSESTEVMSVTTDRLEQKAAQLHNHEAILASAETIGHMKPGAGFELLSDGTVNVVPTLEGLVRRPLSTTPMAGAVPLAGSDGTLGDWASPPALATQTTPGIVKGSETVEIGEDGSVNVVGGAGGLVISPPAVTLPPTVAIGFPFDIRLAAGPVLLPGATVATFEVVVNGGEPVSVPAVAGAAKVSHTPSGEVGTTLTVSTVAVDSLGNRSVASTVQASVLKIAIRTPVIVSPEEGTHQFKQGILIATEPFASTPPGTHILSKYEIETVDGSTVCSFDVTGAHSAHTVTNANLTSGTQYNIFVTHKGESGAKSERSQPVQISISASVILGGGTGDNQNNSGYLYTSPWPGNAWVNAVFETPAGPGMGGPPICAVFGKGKIVLFTASSGTGGVSISYDGIKFTAAKRIGTMQAGLDKIDVLSWKGIGYGAGLFTACGVAGQTSFSEDGVTWSAPITVPGQSANWRCMAYGKGRYVVGGQGGKVASSPDMIHWTTASTISGMTNTICGLRFVNDMFIASSEDGKISVSADGISWNNAIKIYNNRLQDCASDGVTIVLACLDGNVFLSTDAINWSQPYNTGAPLIGGSMSFADGKFYIPGHSRGVFESTDGKIWTPISTVESNRFCYMTLAVV